MISDELTLLTRRSSQLCEIASRSFQAIMGFCLQRGIFELGGWLVASVEATARVDDGGTAL
jgi:hypothetical protein